jgi:carboxyl-terminal processing protease
MCRSSWLAVFMLFIHTQVISQANFKQQSKALKDTLLHYHLTGKPIDQHFSEQLFNDFIDEIDPDKILLTEEDLESIKKFRTTLALEFTGDGNSFLPSFRDLLKACLTRRKNYLDKIVNTPIKAALTASVTINATQKNRCTNFGELEKRWDNDVKAMVFQQVFEVALADSIAPDKMSDAYFLKMEPRARAMVLKKEHRKANHHLNPAEGFAPLLERIFLNAFALQFDPNSNYFTKGEFEKFMASFSKEGFSSGIIPTEDNAGEFTIQTIVPGSPAWRSGQLTASDRLISLKRATEVIDLTEISMDELLQLLNTASQDALELIVKKQNSSLKKVLIKPEKIQLDENVVRGYVIKSTEKIGYIALPGFYTSENDLQEGLQCANDVAKEIMKLKTESIDGLILDLRNNGGGSLAEALAMAGIFIDEGPLGLLKSKEGGAKLLKDGNRGTVYDGPMIVLVNALSASASEILAAALQDYNRALVVGSKTYGKGSGQVVIRLNKGKASDGFVKVTVHRLYRVNGSSVQERGLVPTVQLPDFLHSLNLTEQFQKHHLPFDSISKKVLYAKLPAKINTQELIKKSSNRLLVSPYFSKLNAWIRWFDQYKNSEEQITTWQAFVNNATEVQRKFEEWEHLPITHPLEIQNTTSDANLHKIDRFRDALNQRYLADLKQDFILEEACAIMNEYLTQLKSK